MADRTIRWAVLGPGGIARRFAAAIKGVPGSALVAVGSRDIARARAFADTYGAERAYGSYEELVQDPDVDAVYVATPHMRHCDNAVLCLTHGKAVLVEKPMAINAAEARRMAEAARANGVFLMEAMWSRLLPSVKHAKELVGAGAIGEPRMLSADFSFSAQPDLENRLFDPALAGGSLLDVGTYVMHIATHFFGPPPREAAALCRFGETGMDENAAILLKYPGGQIAALTCGVRALGAGTAAIMGTEGRIELTPFWKAESVRLIRGGEVEDIPFPFTVNGFEYEIAEAADCVRRGLVESPSLPLDEAVAVLEAMDKFRRQWGLKYPME